MSIPIPYCLFVKALTDEKAFESLVQRLAYNKKYSAFTVWPCNHNPPCRKLTDQESIDLSKRLDDRMAKIESDREEVQLMPSSLTLITKKRDKK